MAEPTHHFFFHEGACLSIPIERRTSKWVYLVTSHSALNDKKRIHKKRLVPTEKDALEKELNRLQIRADQIRKEGEELHEELNALMDMKYRRMEYQPQ